MIEASVFTPGAELKETLLFRTARLSPGQKKASVDARSRHCHTYDTPVGGARRAPRGSLAQTGVELEDTELTSPKIPPNFSLPAGTARDRNKRYSTTAAVSEPQLFPKPPRVAGAAPFEGYSVQTRLPTRVFSAPRAC